MTPSELNDYVKKHGAKMIDAKFVDFLGREASRGIAQVIDFGDPEKPLDGPVLHDALSLMMAASLSSRPGARKRATAPARTSSLS